MYNIPVLKNSDINAGVQKQYLIASLKGVIKQVAPSVSLFSTHIKVLTTGGQHDPGVRAQVVRLGERYSAKVPESSQVWLARLEAEKVLWAGDEEGQGRVGETWRLARQRVGGKEEDVLSVWMWGLEDEQVGFVGDRRKMHEVIINNTRLVGADGSGTGITERKYLVTRGT